MNKRKGKILIVDDDPTNVRFLEKALRDLYILDKANDGIEALERVERFRPDLVLLDIMMPRMDGIEVLKKIRANKKLRFQKIIVVGSS
ncbi:PleD family two-component system response regulator, partial [Candidatus Riflebacteria bacterium]